ncbi:MAG: MFS transporter [Verrucomicrobiota bacterium]
MRRKYKYLSKNGNPKTLLLNSYSATFSLMHMRVPTSLPAAPAQPAWYKWELLVLLWLAFFLHQGDRQIYNSVIPLIKTDLGLDDVQLGLIGSIFTLVYGVLVPVAGFIGDILPRKWIVVMSLLIFSIGTTLSGLSSGLIMLVLFRSVTTGGGEAFFYPSATSLLAQFHDKTRALALAILQTALYVGITASGLIAGYIGERYGWRTAFFAFGGVGVLWAGVAAWRLRNTPQVRAAAPQTQPRIPLNEVLWYVLRRPSVWLLSLAFGAMVYVNIGYLTWAPTFLHENFKLSLANAGFSSMFYHHLFAFFGVLIGGKIADRLAEKRPSIRMEANFLGLLCGAPFIYWLGQAPSVEISYIALAGFGLFRGIYDSNLFASLFDVVEPRLRASATGLMLSFAFVIGSLAPTVLGWMKMRVGLATGLSSLAWFYLFGALSILIAVKFFLKRDYVRKK